MDIGKALKVNRLTTKIASLFILNTPRACLEHTRNSFSRLGR